MPADLSSRHTCRSELLAVLRAVRSGSASAEHLDRVAGMVSGLPGGAVEGDAVWAVEQLLRSLAMVVQWTPAIAQADANPLRFRDAARYLATVALTARGTNRWPTPLATAAEKLASIASPDEARTCAEQLIATPLPPRVTDLMVPRGRRAPAIEVEPEDPTADASPAPVLVLLSVNDQPLQSPLAVQPNYLYTVTARVRAPAWPPDAVALHIEFMSILPSASLELAPIRIDRSAESATTMLQLRGALAVGRSEEIILRATYEFSDGKQHVRIVGIPRFRIATFDPATALPRNMPMVAQALLDMLGELDAKLPRFPREDRGSFFTLFESLLRYAQGAIHDTQLAQRDRIPEADFRRDLRRHLTTDREIGGALVGGQQLGGGITDLGLGNIVVELKVEHERTVTFDDSLRYMNQPAHYGAHADRPVTILCILDDSEKNTPPGSLANYIGWQVPSLHGLLDPRFPSMVAVLIVPIRFPLPSDWSATRSTGPTRNRRTQRRRGPS
ncbi:MAG TPA: hypothetical protein VMJ10_14110 [Kofleriaceae bacterium]|nr:hypothetical protein [Kofleriaceae bacterium]